jgi:hypothetical protein
MVTSIELMGLIASQEIFKIYYTIYIFFITTIASVPLLVFLSRNNKNKITTCQALLFLSVVFLVFSLFWKPASAIKLSGPFTVEGVYSCSTSTRTGQGLSLIVNGIVLDSNFDFSRGFGLNCDREFNGKKVRIVYSKFHDKRDDNFVNLILSLKLTEGGNYYIDNARVISDINSSEEKWDFLRLVLLGFSIVLMCGSFFLRGK